MKKILALLLAILMVVSFAACGKKEDSKQEETLDALGRIKKAGKIIVAMEGNWSPWTYHDEKDVLTGYDVDLAKGIAKHLGVEAEFVEGEWDGLFAGLDSHIYDMICNGVDVTPAREEKYNFGEPYALIRTVLVVGKDNETIKSFEDLKGKTTANSIGSTYMEMAEDFGATVSGVDTLGETMQMVLMGRVDATLNADVSVAEYFAEQPDAALKIVAETPEANAVAVPIPKGDDFATLRAAVDDAIKAMKADGTLSQLSIKYFGIDVSK